MRAVWLGAWLAVMSAACLFPSLDGLSGAPADADAQGDVAPDAPDASAGPTVIASAGSVSTATGNAQQAHVVWAALSKRWWLFYVDDDTTHLKTRSSTDFVTWTDGASLVLPHPTGGDGRNFAVAYALIGGADVVHVSFSHAEPSKLTHSHTRALVQGDSITFGAPVDVGTPVSQGSSGPDGPAPLVASDGTVWDSTGFTISQNSDAGHYNEDMFSASMVEDGSQSWNATFTQKTVEIVSQMANAHAMLDVGAPLAIWDDGIDEPHPTNLHYSLYSGSWGAVASTFAADAPQDANDWGAAVLRVGSTLEPHVLRARAAGGYDHAVASNGAGPVPPTLARTTGGGLVLLADPAHLAAFDLASDGSVQRSRWDGANFGAWESIAAPRTRAWLSGTCPDLGAHPEAGGCALLWTEPSTGGYAIVGTLVRVAP